MPHKRDEDAEVLESLEVNPVNVVILEYIEVLLHGGDMLDVKRLQILLAVVEGGSVTSAADELFILRREFPSSCENSKKRLANPYFSATREA